MMRRAPTVLAIAALAVGAWPAADAAAATLTVNRPDDPAVGNVANDCSGTAGDCSLRQAIAKANAAGGANTIDLPAGVYTLTIAPSGADDNSSGDLNVTASGGTTTITGAGAAGTVVQWASLASAPDRVLHVDAVASASISGVTIRFGQAQGTDSGGGILDDGTLTLDSAVVTDNASGPTVMFNAPGAGGGGIDVQGSATITNSTLSNNSAGPNRGGAVRLGSGSAPTATITGSTITGNSAASGGGVDTDGKGAASIAGSTVSGNSSPDGGGIAEEGGGPVTIDATTISGNSAPSGGVGGGVSEEGGGTITIGRSTIEGNRSGNGGGIAQEGGGAVTVTQSTIDDNTAASGGGLAQEAIDPSTPAPAFTLTNDTITGNQSTSTRASSGGGGLLGDGSGTVVLLNSTVAANTAAAGQGGDLEGDGTTIDLTNTIVAGGGPVDCTGSRLFSTGTHGHGSAAGHNLASDSTCGLSAANGDLFPLDPQTGPLANNGGPTRTMALFTGSPAIGAANAASCPATDQRGDPRGQTNCDIGAFEGSVAAPRPTATSLACAPSTVLLGGQTQCTTTVTDTGAGTPTAPTGPVTVAGRTCTLAPAAGPGAAGCAVTYAPAIAGIQTLTASYGGDASHSASSSSATVSVIGPPHTFILSGPSGFTSSAPTFTFISDTVGSAFQCSWDGQAFTPCASPTSNYLLTFGAHTFSVRAVSPQGLVDPNPPVRSFTLGIQFVTYSCTVNAHVAGFVLPVPNGGGAWYTPDQGFSIGDSECDMQATCPVGSKCTVSDEHMDVSGVTGETFGEAAVDTCGPAPMTGQLIPCYDSLDLVLQHFRCYWNPRYGDGCELPIWDRGAAFLPQPAFDSNCWFFQLDPANAGSGPITCSVDIKIVPYHTPFVSGFGSTVTAFAPAPGLLSMTAALPGAASDARVHRHRVPPPVAPVHVRVTQAGNVTLPFRLSPASRATIRWRGKLALVLTIKLVGADGHTLTTHQRVVLPGRTCFKRTTIRRRHHRVVIIKPYLCTARAVTAEGRGLDLHDLGRDTLSSHETRRRDARIDA